MSSLAALEAIRCYLEGGALLALAWALFRVFEVSSTKLGLRADHRMWARFGYLALALALLLPAALLALPRSTLLRPSAQVWSGGARTAAPGYALISPMPASPLSGAPATGLKLERSALSGALAALLGSIAFSILLLAFRVVRLHLALGRLPVIRRLGQVRIVASDRHAVAFSAWLPGRAVVVLPMELLSEAEDMRIAIQHELQHHRSRDTIWLYFLELVAAAYFWNPAMRGMRRILGQLQEFACDEFLIGRRKVSARAYGSCLLKAAETAVTPRPLPVGTAGMAHCGDGSLLKRRIEMILNHKNPANPAARRLMWIAATAIAALMTTAAYAARSAVQDRSITMSEARTYAERASRDSGIPIEVNELVLARLNRFVGTPEGRRFVQDALARMPNYRAMIERKLDRHELPRDLLAIPLYESGFRNDVVSPPPYRAAGIWQFVPETARKYKLVVNGELDERLSPEKETDAAVRYLGYLNGLFQDWRLALKAYNEGERHVLDLIDRLGTRDPWALERAESREGYLAGAVAMIIVLRNPELLN